MDDGRRLWHVLWRRRVERMALPTSLDTYRRDGRLPQRRRVRRTQPLGLTPISTNRVRSWCVFEFSLRLPRSADPLLGSAGFVAINNADGGWSTMFTTALPDGTYRDVVGGSATYTVSGGTVNVDVPARNAVAIHVGAKA